MGEPAVANENVAAIDGETKKSGPSTMPMVIRGGVVGDAFSAPGGGPVAVRPQAVAQEPPPSESAASRIGAERPGTASANRAGPPAGMSRRLDADHSGDHPVHEGK